MTQDYIKPFFCGDFSFLGCICFSKDGRNLLLSDSGCVILLDDELTNTVRNGNPAESLKLKLVQHGLATVPGKVMFKCEKEVDPRYFIIDLTKKCNFDCIYCFRDLEKMDTISFGVLKDILEYILAYCHENNIRQISLQMWGGEPLLALDRIEYVVNFFKKTDIRAAIDIETNGSLVTEDIARKLYQLDINVGVSIDGTPELHDRQRMLCSGAGSFEKVKTGIRNLQSVYGNNIGGITVVTKYNCAHVREMLDYYIYELGLTSVKFNIVRDNANAGEGRLGLSADEVEKFADQLMDYLQAYRMLGANFSEGNVELRAENLLRRSGVSCCISCGCQGGKKIISFDQNGDIFPCEMTDFTEEKLGSIYDNEKLVSQIKKAVGVNRFFLKKEDEKCGDCPWWYYCRGGCSSRNRYLGLDGKNDTVECSLNRIIYPRLVEWILDDYIC